VIGDQIGRRREEQGVRAELIDRARQGDREAFSVLAGGAVDRLYAIARLTPRDADLSASG
jgi:hypothetical protein